MARKKFVPPYLKKPTTTDEESKEVVKPTTTTSTLSTTSENTTTEQTKSTVAQSNPLKRKFQPPRSLGGNTSSTAQKNTTATKTTVSTNDDDMEEGEVWAVMHCKTSNKKHKSFDDGILLVKKKRYILHDSSGKVLINKLVPNTISDLREGHVIVIGTKECEMMNRVDLEEYNSGRIFLDNHVPSKPVKTVKQPKQVFTKFKSPVTDETKLATPKIKKTEVPMGCHILNPGSDPNISSVYIDSFICRVLRPHQVEGIQFMYDCVMGVKSKHHLGCLLADEMGLGKTLQTIALMWTLLSRGPQSKPVLKKVIIVTNSSLVQNWRKEIKYWLGDANLKPLVCSAKAGKVTPAATISDFKTGYEKCMIISYDLCTRYASALRDLRCDLLICDEGHKLKNANIKIFKALKEVKTKRRIVLSGTPVQNDLGEFFCIADFLNPGIVGDAVGFKSLFTDPINLSREPNATPYQKQIGAKRSQELSNIINQFILRRTSDVLRAHLPPKNEFIVFCKMAPLQEHLYTHFLSASKIPTSATLTMNNALSCIQGLKKLLTHPNMIYNYFLKQNTGDSNKKKQIAAAKRKSNSSDDDDSDQSDLSDEEGVNDAVDNFRETWGLTFKQFPKDYKMDPMDISLSGKMYLLSSLLKQFKEVGDRVVIVSNFTSILSQIEVLCGLNNYNFVRLDGSTVSEKRMKIVESFNNPNSNDFVFLLSSKAGGAGLNIIGGNRLVLFDPDWNPSNDIQAMARVWRDGQKKHVFIYRFVSTGTIEEKIFQRQLVKTGLSKTVVDDQKSKAAFSKDMLKQLFVYKGQDRCETYPQEAAISNNIDKMNTIDPSLYNAIQDLKQNNEDEEDDDSNGSSHWISFIKVVDDKVKKEEKDDEDIMDLELDQSLPTTAKDTQVDKEDGEDEYEFDQNADEENDDDYREDGDEEGRPSKKRKLQ